jgi:hypothetical protein
VVLCKLPEHSQCDQTVGDLQMDPGEGFPLAAQASNIRSWRLYTITQNNDSLRDARLAWNRVTTSTPTSFSQLLNICSTFTEEKTAAAWKWTHTPTYCWGEECMEHHIHASIIPLVALLRSTRFSATPSIFPLAISMITALPGPNCAY